MVRAHFREALFGHDFIGVLPASHWYEQEAGCCGMGGYPSQCYADEMKQHYTFYGMNSGAFFLFVMQQASPSSRPRNHTHTSTDHGALWLS